MMEVIVEKMQDCKLVRETHEDNGHDCWGNYEYTTNYHVYIDKCKERVHKDMFIIHDGETVLEIAFDFNLDANIHRAKVKLAMRDQTKLEL